MGMILILGVVVIGGFFLLQSGGLSNLLQPQTEEQPAEGEGEDDGMGDEDMGGGGGYPRPYPVPVPVPVPVGGRPRPPFRRSPPFVPVPRPPNPCGKYCFPGPFYNPPKCRMCKDAIGRPVHAFRARGGGCGCH